MIIATGGLVLDTTFEFASDVSLPVLISEFQSHVVLCRNCAMDSFCIVKEHDDTCQVSAKIVENFIKTHILRIDYSNKSEVEDFCQCLYDFLDVIEKFKLFVGTIADDKLVDFFLGSQPNITLKYGHRLIRELGSMFDHFHVVNHKEIKKFMLLLEGDSEEIFIPGLLSALGVDGIDQEWNRTIFIINLKGKDKIQKDKIASILSMYRDNKTSYFLVIDNDAQVGGYLEDLKRAGLLDQDHYVLWDIAFEDNFSLL